MAKKQKLKTIKEYQKWNVIKWSLYGAMFVTPLAPAATMTAINWEDWFAKSGVSLPCGFVMLVISTLLSIIFIWKKDEITKKSVSAIFYLSLVFACFGCAFMFLAKLFEQVGHIFLATALGLVASGTSDQFNKSLVKPRVAEYKELIDTNGLDTRAKKKAERKAQAKADAEKEAAERQAVE